MTAQNIFYISGSVVFVVFLLFILALWLFLYGLQRKINRWHRFARFLGIEIGVALRDTEKLFRYLKASIGASLLAKLLKILKD